MVITFYVNIFFFNSNWIWFYIYRA